MNQGYAGSSLGQDAKVPEAPTINARLNKLSEGLQYQCERIESVLCRVNGTPQQAPSGQGRANVATITPTLSMSVVVEHLEAAYSRLQDLATNVERIA